jgi:hypothetical protein
MASKRLSADKQEPPTKVVVNDDPIEPALTTTASQTASGHNLTGGQIQEIFDSLIYESIKPIILHSNIFDLQITYLLSVASRNRKRKLSAMPREELVTVLAKYLVTPDKNTKFYLLASCKLERSFVHKFVVNFLKECEGYDIIYNEFLVTTDPNKHRKLDLKLSAIEGRLGFHRDHLFSAIYIARDYLDLAYEFRNSIVHQYIKLARGYSVAYCTDKPNMDSKDMAQNLLHAVITALDKYDSSKGALTTYVKWWLMNARDSSHTDHSHEYGIAYTIPYMQRRNMAISKDKPSNFSVSLHATDDDGNEYIQELEGGQSVDQDLETEEQALVIRRLAKAADPLGLARLYMDIDEVFNVQELDQMRDYMESQGTYKVTNCK